MEVAWARESIPRRCGGAAIEHVWDNKADQGQDSGSTSKPMSQYFEDVDGLAVRDEKKGGNGWSFPGALRVRKSGERVSQGDQLPFP